MIILDNEQTPRVAHTLSTMYATRGSRYDSPGGRKHDR